MIKYLLDTNVISEAIKTVPNQNVMNKLQKHQDEIATASVVWHELQYGCRRLPTSRKRALIESYLAEVVWRTIAVLPYDAAAADWHAEQRAKLTTAGKSPPFIDGQIAAVAKVNDLILVTRNISDYACFKDLRLQNWHKKNRIGHGFSRKQRIQILCVAVSKKIKGKSFATDPHGRTQTI